MWNKQRGTKHMRARILFTIVFMLFACLAEAQVSVGTTWWVNEQRPSGLLKLAIGESRWFKVIGDQDPNYYDVELPNGETGVINKELLDRSVQYKSVLDYDPVEKLRRDKAAAKARAAKASADRIAAIKAKHWPSAIEKAVIEKKIQIGMTAEQVRLAWGKPRRINRSVGVWGTHEQWVYGSTYLYFENDILTSFQDSR